MTAQSGGARPVDQGRSAPVALPSPVVLLYLFCVVIPVGFNLGPLYLTSLRLLLLALVLPLLVQLLSGKFGRLHAVDILFLLHVLWIGVALLANSPSQLATQMGSVGVEFLGGYLVGRAHVRSRAAFLALCYALAIIVLLLMPFALYESQTGRPVIVEMLRKLPGISTVGMVTIEGRLGLERVQASFTHPIHFGIFCSVAFSLCFVALKDVLPFGRRLLFSGLIMLSGFLALSSGALLAMALQVALIAWSIVFARLAWRWWLLVGLFALAYVVIDVFSDRSPIRVFMSYATFSAHNAYWRGIIFDWGIKNIFGDGAMGIPASPWVGIGLNDWVRPWFMRSGSMDNFWLVMGVRYGVPGFLLLALGYGLAIFHVMRRDFTADPVLAQIRRAWVFTFLGLTFTLCTVHVWTNVYSFVFFMFGAGVWLIAEMPRGAEGAAPQPLPPGRARLPETAGPVAPPVPGQRPASPHTRFPPRPAPAARAGR
jgi:hypothetical protein